MTGQPTPYAAEDAILEASQQEHFPYHITRCGKTYIVLQNVFSPKYFPDVDMFAGQLPIQPGSSFLEIGAGIGFVAIEAAYKGAQRVVAIDMNPDAVENARQNIQHHQMADKVEARQGSVYSPLQANETFDVIYWNVPFQFVAQGTPRTLLQKSTCDIGYQSTSEYIQQGAKHLSPQGRLFIGFSSSIGRIGKLQEVVRQYNARLQCVAQKTVGRKNQPVSFELFEVVYYCGSNASSAAQNKENW